MKPVKLYDDIFDLPLSIFIEVVCNSKYELLSISGKPTDQQLSDCWTKIYTQYLDLIDDTESIYILELKADYSTLVQKISEIETSLYFLKVRYDARLVQIIKRNGIQVNLNPEDQENYLADIKRVQARLAPWKMQKQDLEAQITNYEQDKGDGKVDKNSFFQMLQRLAKFQHVTVINPKEISAGQYAILLKDYVYYHSQLKAQQYGEEG